MFSYLRAHPKFRVWFNFFLNQKRYLVHLLENILVEARNLANDDDDDDDDEAA